MNYKNTSIVLLAAVLYGCGAETQDGPAIGTAELQEKPAEQQPPAEDCETNDIQDTEMVCDPDSEAAPENGSLPPEQQPEDQPGSGEPSSPEEAPPEEAPHDEQPEVQANADLCSNDCIVSRHRFDSAKTIAAQHQITVDANTLEELLLQPSASEALAVDYQTPQRLQNIRFVYVSDTMLELHNQTPRAFKSMLANDADGNPVIVRFSSVIKPYHKTTLSGSNITPLTYQPGSIVFSPMFTHSGKAESECPAAEGDNGWTCGVTPTKDETQAIDTLTANTKTVLSSQHLLPLLKLSAFGGNYKNTQRKGRFCSDTATCKANEEGTTATRGYLFSLASANHNMTISRLKTYKRGFQGIGWGSKPHKEWGQGHQGSNNGITLKFLGTPLKTGQYNTYLHEIGHAMRYGHSSGFTYGFPDALKGFLSANIEYRELIAYEAPETITRLTIAGNALIATFYSSTKVKSNKVTFQLSNFHDMAYQIKRSKDKPSIAIEFEALPKSRILFLTDNSVNDSTMSQDIFPGKTYLEPLDDGYFISTEAIAATPQDLFLDPATNPKKLTHVCKAYLGRRYTLASPEYALDIARNHPAFVDSLENADVSTRDEEGTAYSVNLKDLTRKRSKRIGNHHVICQLFN